MLLPLKHANQVNEYPSQRMFKAVGVSDESFQADMSKVVEDVLRIELQPGMVNVRPSSKGKYISVQIGPVIVKSADQVRIPQTLPIPPTTVAVGSAGSCRTAVLLPRGCCMKWWQCCLTAISISVTSSYRMQAIPYGQLDTPFPRMLPPAPADAAFPVHLTDLIRQQCHHATVAGARGVCRDEGRHPFKMGDVISSRAL